MKIKKWSSKTLGTEPLEEMSAFFDKRAEIYDQVHLENIGGGIESKNIIASFLPEYTQTIADLGIGTGLELREIFKRFPNVKVTGLDISKDMLRQLKSSYPDQSISLLCESYLDFDFGISRYDAALSVMTMHHYGHKTKTDLYRRIYSCIKEKGVYIECDYMLSEDEYENAQELEDFYFSEYEALQKKQNITDGRQYHYDTPCTVKNQIRLLLGAGFKSVREVWRDGNTVILVADKQ